MKEISPEDLPRRLTYCEKSSDDYLGNISLLKINLNILRELWSQSLDEPMIEVFPVDTNDQVMFLEKILNQKLEINKFDYFLEIG
jgi:hypothetical protein